MQEKNSFIFTTLKGVILTVLFSLISVLLFALVIRLTSMGNSAIKPINQVLKAICIFLGCVFSINGKMGIVKGMLIGVFSIILVFLIFSLISGMSVFSSSFFIDLLFGLIVGSISGIVAVNVKK